MVIFNSYVSLPEGNWGCNPHGASCDTAGVPGRGAVAGNCATRCRAVSEAAWGHWSAPEMQRGYPKRRCGGQIC